MPSARVPRARPPPRSTRGCAGPVPRSAGARVCTRPPSPAKGRRAPPAACRPWHVRAAPSDEPSARERACRDGGAAGASGTQGAARPPRATPSTHGCCAPPAACRPRLVRAAPREELSVREGACCNGGTAGAPGTTGAMRPPRAASSTQSQSCCDGGAKGAPGACRAKHSHDASPKAMPCCISVRGREHSRLRVAHRPDRPHARRDCASGAVARDGAETAN